MFKCFKNKLLLKQAILAHAKCSQNAGVFYVVAIYLLRYSISHLTVIFKNNIPQPKPPG